MLVHLRSTNSLPNEKRETRPDAAISEKPHLEFTSSIGFGEAKVKQRFSARYSLCIDNLRLITFCKNTIDDNKLDGAIAFQIHGKEVKKKAGIIVTLTTPSRSRYAHHFFLNVIGSHWFVHFC